MKIDYIWVHSKSADQWRNQAWVYPGQARVKFTVVMFVAHPPFVLIRQCMCRHALRVYWAFGVFALVWAPTNPLGESNGALVSVLSL
jgi:hypothetical protein